MESGNDMKSPMSRTWTAPVGLELSELRLMSLPGRKHAYLVLVDADGMRCVARTMGEREATLLASWLDAVSGRDSEMGAVGDMP
jgi:hypothetical protein